MVIILLSIKGTVEQPISVTVSECLLNAKIPSFPDDEVITLWIDQRPWAHLTSSTAGSLWWCLPPANIHQQTTAWEEFCYLGVLLPYRPQQNHTQITVSELSKTQRHNRTMTMPLQRMVDLKQLNSEAV